jgi:hypothetical protein
LEAQLGSSDIKTDIKKRGEKRACEEGTKLESFISALVTLASEGVMLRYEHFAYQFRGRVFCSGHFGDTGD